MVHRNDTTLEHALAPHKVPLAARARRAFGDQAVEALLPTLASDRKQRGRGSLTNSSGRFEAERREPDDAVLDLEEDSKLVTEVTEEKARIIITRNDSPDLGFDRSINAYRGCEHGCSYCFARPSHAYLGLSPGLDFETRLFVKPNAPELLLKELAAAGYQPRTIAMGTNTDPYQPIERHYRVTRRLLEILRDWNHPVSIVTKSALVLRDSDILADMASRDLVKVALSITTLDSALARAMEPRASTPARRLAALKGLSDAGVPTAVMVAPVIPAINDHEVERILDAAYAQGAREAGFVVLRLPHELRDLFRQWLVAHRPDAARRVLSIVQDMREGRDYDARFGMRQRGTGPYAIMIGRRFDIAMRRLGFNARRLRLRTDLFAPPAAFADARAEQLDLFAR